MVIAHLYKDLLNLYGNDGNTKILKQKLNQMRCKVDIVEPSISDEMDFDKYDLVFVGSGTERNLELAINDLKRYKSDIEKAIEDGKIFLAMGNALDIFGIDGIGVFDYKSLAVDRIKADVRRKSIFVREELLGFENHSHVLADANGKILEEQDFIKNNFYGSYVEAPILVRNPAFLKKILSKLTDGNLQRLNLELEEKAYSNFIKILDGGIK